MITKGEVKKKGDSLKQMDSFDEIAYQNIEEGKTSSVSDFIIRSPNI